MSLSYYPLTNLSPASSRPTTSTSSQANIDLEQGLSHTSSSSALDLLKPAPELKLPTSSSDLTVAIIEPPKPVHEKGHEIPPSTAPPQTAPSKPAAKKNSFVRASRWIRFRLWFNTYRKFFVITILINIIILILELVDVISYPKRHAGTLILINLLISILMRSELFGRVLYLVINTLYAKWTPLWWRLWCTSSLQHLGGIHSGCALSACMWLLYRLVQIFSDSTLWHNAYLCMGVVVTTAVVVSISAAIPWVRNTHHNVFERYHRFAGWFGVAATWVFVILGETWDESELAWNVDKLHLARLPDFWLCLLLTFFVVFPWFTIRKVPVEVEIPSSKAVILKFKRGMQQGLLARIATSPVMEYHAFGIISKGKASGEHLLICGVQGDFTRSLVDHPPTYIWTRELKLAGVSNTSSLYKRGIRVCTGTGLGAALSTCLQSPDWYLIWIGSDQEKTFGPTISDLIHNNLQGRVTLWDSKERGGRPDTMKLIKETFEAWEAEVIFITSNFQGNKEMMEGCKSAGIPAFGTLWDF